MAHILVVDDEPAIAELFQILLANAGHAVTVADSAEAALERVAHERYDLIVADVRMPGAGGTALANWFRTVNKRKTPVVACTGYYHGSMLRSMGFDGYILKPIEAAMFVPTVESFLAAAPV